MARSLWRISTPFTRAMTGPASAAGASLLAAPGAGFEASFEQPDTAGRRNSPTAVMAASRRKLRAATGRAARPESDDAICSKGIGRSLKVIPSSAVDRHLPAGARDRQDDRANRQQPTCVAAPDSRAIAPSLQWL